MSHGMANNLQAPQYHAYDAAAEDREAERAHLMTEHLRAIKASVLPFIAALKAAAAKFGMETPGWRFCSMRTVRSACQIKVTIRKEADE